MNTDKGDGRHASIRGKNYALGYWKKKLEQATEEGDKLGIRVAKMEILRLERKRNMTNLKDKINHENI